MSQPIFISQGERDPCQRGVRSLSSLAFARPFESKRIAMASQGLLFPSTAGHDVVPMRAGGTSICDSTLIADAESGLPLRSPVVIRKCTGRWGQHRWETRCSLRGRMATLHPRPAGRPTSRNTVQVFDTFHTTLWMPLCGARMATVRQSYIARKKRAGEGT